MVQKFHLRPLIKLIQRKENIIAVVRLALKQPDKGFIYLEYGTEIKAEIKNTQVQNQNLNQNQEQQVNDQASIENQKIKQTDNTMYYALGIGGSIGIISLTGMGYIIIKKLLANYSAQALQSKVQPDDQISTQNQKKKNNKNPNIDNAEPMSIQEFNKQYQKIENDSNCSQFMETKYIDKISNTTYDVLEVQQDDFLQLLYLQEEEFLLSRLSRISENIVQPELFISIENSNFYQNNQEKLKILKQLSISGEETLAKKINNQKIKNVYFSIDEIRDLYNDLLSAFHSFHKQKKPVKHVNPSNIAQYSKSAGLGNNGR